MMVESWLLRSRVVDVAVRSSLAEAFEWLREGQPDLAIVDINLGEETSYPLIEVLETRDVPVILATGYSSSEVAEPCRETPMLQKPSVFQRLISTVDRLCPLVAVSP